MSQAFDPFSPIAPHLPSKDGFVAFAPIPNQLFPGTICEPNLLFIAPENAPGDEVEYPSHLDLAMEIVSKVPEAHKRDYEDKVRDTAKAGIFEYWIVDPQEAKITVLVLEGDAYVEHGVYLPGNIAGGRFLPNLPVDVTRVMNA